MYRLPNGCTAQALSLCSGGHLGSEHALRCTQRTEQALALGVGLLIQAQPAARVAFASQQNICKALGLAKGVAALEQPHQGCCAEFAALVDVAVLARHDIGQFAAVIGHTQSQAQGFE